MVKSFEAANVGKVVAARVGTNIREIRTKLGMTQAQLASPEFSISYISALERGKIRPSLKVLSILARRLDVPLTFLLEGSPSGAAEARVVDYSPTDVGPDQKIDVDMLQTNVLLQKGAYRQTEQLLALIQAERITTDQVSTLYLLRGEVHLGLNEYQESLVGLHQAVGQAEAMNDAEITERIRNFLRRAYFSLYNYTLAIENHLCSNHAIENRTVSDPVFALAVYSNLANDYFRLGDLENAVSYYHRAQALFENMEHDSLSFAQTYMDISQQYKIAGKLAMARDYAMHSLALYEMRDELWLVGLTYQRLGKTLKRQNDLEAAEKEYRRAIAIGSDLNDSIASSTCHTSLAEHLLKRGNVQETKQEALLGTRSSGDPLTQGQTLMALALLRHQIGDYTAANDLFTQAMELLDASYPHEIAAAACFRFANLLAKRTEGCAV